jgi:MFS family permease
LYFALGWAASAHGGRVAAAVLTAVNLPRTVLLLVGGAVGDRFGARRVMLVGDAVMLAATLVLAVGGRHLGTLPRGLIVIGALIGTVDAFYLPATGSMPRRLVGTDELPRALAARQVCSQIASMLGASLGGVLIALGGLSGAALADAGTFAVVFVVLVWVRPTFAVGRSSRTENLLRGALDGVRTVVGDPVLRVALLLTATAAGFLLPVVSLLNPLLARQHGWGAEAAGLVAGAQAVGVVAVALVATRRGIMSRIGVGAAMGLCVAALGIAAVAIAPVAVVAICGGLTMGVGSGIFTCHVGPLVLTSAPETHLSRTQALLTLVQSLGLLAANNALGALADTAGATIATAVCALAMCVAGAMGMASKPLRHARRRCRHGCRHQR